MSGSIGEKERKALIDYRLEQAQEALRDSKLLWEQGGSARSVINRAYYAMFYALLALLTSIGRGSSKHSGVITLFDREFVKAGLFPKEDSKMIHKAFKLRQVGDYKEFAPIDLQDAKELLRKAEDFVQRVKVFLTR